MIAQTLYALLAFFGGCAIGALVERGRWLRSDCARLWTRVTGQKGRLL